MLLSYFNKRGFGFSGCLSITRCLAAGSPKIVFIREAISSTSQQGGESKCDDQRPSKFACTAYSGRHEMTSDLMPQAHGNDLGPSPKEYLMTSLGTCTAMTIRTFFENTMTRSPSTWKGATLERIQISVEEVSSPQDEHLPLGLNVFVTLVGNLTDQQKFRLIQAANGCPVKKMLSGGLINGVTTHSASNLDPTA